MEVRRGISTGSQLADAVSDCRKRWFHSLDPSLRKGRWTKDEDRIILDAYQQLGPSWKQIGG